MADDILQMQRQAARRVQQMQQHSRQVFEAHQQAEHPPAPTPTPVPHADNDRLLILGLALLLYRNGGRPELLLALLYLAM